MGPVKRNKLISNTNTGSSSTIKIRKIKTKKLPSRISKEATEVTQSVESMVDTGGITADLIQKPPNMIHHHYKLVTPETKEVKVEAEALEENSKAEDLVEDSK